MFYGLLAKIGGTTAGWLMTQLLNRPKEWVGRKIADAKAERGEDLAGKTSLQRLVTQELERISNLDELPHGFLPGAFRNWLLREGTIRAVVEGVITKCGGGEDIAFSSDVEQQLNDEYAQLAQGSRTLPPRAIDYLVSRVVGGLRASDAGRKALDAAVTQWIGLQLYKETHADRLPSPGVEELARARKLAVALMEAGRRSWKIPDFIAPFNIETRSLQGGVDPRPIAKSEILSLIRDGQHLLMVGPGGIGKTTLLLDLCAECLEQDIRIPIFVDAAIWGRTGAGLSEYLSSRSAALTLGIRASEISRLMTSGSIVIMLNGWNEIPASMKLVCANAVTELIATAPKLGIVAVSRSPSDAPSLSSAKNIDVQGLRWSGQTSVIRRELLEADARAVLDLLAADTRLRLAARSPLILRGLIAQARVGLVIHASVYDLLGAAVGAFEQDEQRRQVLRSRPVDGHHRAYLEELACWLTQNLTTNCSRNDALAAIGTASDRLRERHVIGEMPNLTEVLEVLVSDHLLHCDNDLVRFAHQRFQEYFAATRILANCRGEGEADALSTAVDGPAWSDALMLVGSKLKGAADAAARARLVGAAATVDTGLASDLSGMCAFCDTDDAALHQRLVSRIQALARSNLEEVRTLGMAYAIASGFPDFADMIWMFLESNDQQVRLSTYQLNSFGISFRQLGEHAEARIGAWPLERKIEFIQQIAASQESYAYLVRMAQGELDVQLRAHAINALFWHFAASDAPIEAWLAAPQEVQVEPAVLSHIVEFSGDFPTVRERLRRIADTSDDVRIRLALEFPVEEGERAVGVALDRLSNPDRTGMDEQLIVIARTHAPDQLIEEARRLALETRAVPDWIGDTLLNAHPDIRHVVFDDAWVRIQGADFRTLSPQVLGPLADRDQVERMVGSWLASAARSRELSNQERERHDLLRYLLANASGDELLNIVLTRGPAASYTESVELSSLLLQRMNDDGVDRRRRNWTPDRTAARRLVDVFNGKQEPGVIPQDELRINLCRVVSRVAPEAYGDFLIETCRRHLDGWAAFHARRVGGTNPHHGTALMASLSAWGPDALEGLLALVGHPAALNFIPDAVARVVALPWASKRPPQFWNGLNGDIQEGEIRRKAGRALQQPEDTYQHWTNVAAQVLGQKLREMVRFYQDLKVSGGNNWRPLEAHFQLRRLAGVVANIPSPAILEPVCEAVISGLMDIWGSNGAVRGLIRQGWVVDSPAVVQQLETLHVETATPKWRDDSWRHSMADLSELLIVAVPGSLLGQSSHYYLQQMRDYSNTREVIRRLGAAHSDSSWPALIDLCQNLGTERRELVPELIGALTPQHVPNFLQLVADGTLFGWVGDAWSVNRAAAAKADIIEASVGAQDFANACRHARSISADALAAAVLSEMKDSEAVRESYGLEALDAGRVDPNYSVTRMLNALFHLRIPLGHSQYEIRPQSRNGLRAQLYERSMTRGVAGDSCRRMLATLEHSRRESGRPNDEPRHPHRADGRCWTDSLSMPDAGA